MRTPFERILSHTLRESRRIAHDIRYQHPDATIYYDPYANNALLSHLAVFVRHGSGWLGWLVRDGEPGQKVYLRSRAALKQALEGLITFQSLPA